MCRCEQSTHRTRGPAPVPRAAGVVPAAARVTGVELVYEGRTALLLKGPVSRRVYALKPGMKPLVVDARDTEALVASGLFQRGVAGREPSRQEFMRIE